MDQFQAATRITFTPPPSQLEASVFSDAGQWFFHIDVAVTCPNELPRMCKVELCEGCKGTDVTGQPLRCLPTWTAVLADNLVAPSSRT